MTFDESTVRRAHGRFTHKENSEVDAAVVASFTHVQLAGAPVPTLTLAEAFHVGDLDPSLKKARSYEGSGLSISVHPEEWQSIARLSGQTWRVSVPGNRLLSYHELTVEQRDALHAFGLERGYIEPAIRYSVSWYDDEWEDTFSATFATREEAEYETEEYADENGDKVAVEEVTVMVATAAFPDNTVTAGDDGTEQILAAIWVNDETDLDGVWWEDTLDPDRLSAPRGVIAARRIDAWLATAELVEE